MIFDRCVIDAALGHAAECSPREACGVVIIHKGRQVYRPCRNLSRGESHFIIDPVDMAEAEDQGEIVAIVHSHPDVPPAPGEADRVSCEAWGLPWLIVSWPSGDHGVLEPSGYVAPYVGRVYVYGSMDCYGLVQDWYRAELGIRLPAIIRPERWWKEGGNLYLEHVQAAGFMPVLNPDLPQRGDLIFMRIDSPEHPNHAAIYLGEGQILHHLEGRLSSRDTYGDFYRRVTHSVWRHRDHLR